MSRPIVGQRYWIIVLMFKYVFIEVFLKILTFTLLSCSILGLFKGFILYYGDNFGSNTLNSVCEDRNHSKSMNFKSRKECSLSQFIFLVGTSQRCCGRTKSWKSLHLVQHWCPTESHDVSNQGNIFEATFLWKFSNKNPLEKFCPPLSVAYVYIRNTCMYSAMSVGWYSGLGAQRR